MKTIKLALFLIFTCLSSLTNANDALEIFYQAFNFAKNESPFSQQINWDSIEANALQFIGKEDIACRGTSAIATILAPALAEYDFHTGVTDEGLGSSQCPNHKPEKIDRYWQDWIALSSKKRDFIKRKASSFWGKRYGDIAYIYVPAGFAFDAEGKETSIKEARKVVDSLNLGTAKGIIVDFRMNWGGNYFPMLLGLAKIIDPGLLFKYSSGESTYLSEDGNRLFAILTDGTEDTLHQTTSFPPVQKLKLPTVILVDQGTGSSGAISAFALKENQSTNKLIGEPSSSSFSVNATIPLKDGNYFYLMILKLVSPSGVEQPLYLDVDFQVAHDFNTMFGENDQSIAYALEVLTH